MKHLGDITKISGYDVPMVDVVIGGSPCQDLSTAGKRAGLAGERSGLFMEQIRIIKEMRYRDAKAGWSNELIRPRYMVWENVPGAFSSNKGQDFKAVLEEIIRIAEPEAPDIPLPPKGKWPMADCWYGDGWSVAYRVLDAQFWGVPQRRRRIALVADFGGHTAPEILFERKSVCGDTAESSAPRKEAAAEVGSGASPTVWCLQGDGIDRADTAGCNGRGWKRDVSYTLNTIDRHAVCTSVVMATGQAGAEITNDISPTLNCNHEQPIVAHTLRARGTDPHREDAATYLIKHGKVRRLTPLECERLQGFPDGWTDIGAWTDSKGKLHKESSDSARYKALGNSIAIPPWMWVLSRLYACYEHPRPTMASLFDGIGGFPFIWEQISGKGTCLWSSEIEEFPIAVTKRRFNNGDSSTKIE